MGRWVAATDKTGGEVLVVHYSEIVLKLGRRAMFVGRLTENLRRALDATRATVAPVDGRLVVALDGHPPAEIMNRLLPVPGVANICVARRTEPDLEAIEGTVAELVAATPPAGSFKIAVKRADKSFCPDSPEVARRLGAMVVAATGAPVDLSRPDHVIRVEITSSAAFVSDQRVEGCGGLPVSTGGRVLLLLSGGIDSPVAGLRMMRRGCRVDTLHFHSVPYLDGSSRDKALQLSELLARGQGHTRLMEVAFGDTQSEIVRFVPRPLRVVLYRRMMMRIASRLGRDLGCSALVTGESLGQVASQTLANMTVIEEAASLPVLRPLVGMDKLEITDYGRRAGTYEISIIPDQDCCTLFVPKHPSTAASLSEVEAAEEALDIKGLVEAAASPCKCRRIEVAHKYG